MSPSYYNLSIYIPTNGYSFDTAIQIADVANRLETSYNYSTKSLFETLYFNISVHAFQRFLLNVTETAPSITQDTSVSLYTPAGPFPPFPFIIDQTLQNGGIVLTWVPNGNVNSMWIVLSQGGLPENYTMVFSVQTSGYSFDSAILVASNQTHLQWINFTDEWPTVLYYKFFINQTGIGTWVNISEKNSGSSLLTNAQVFIYAPNENYKVLQLNELNSPITGQITGNFTAMTSGYYYIVVSLGSSSTPIPSKEAYTILLLYTYPPVVPVQSFQWTFLNILLSFLILFVLPGVFFGIDMFVKPEPIQWHILLSGEVVYNAISKNPRFENKYEFPTESILFEPPYIGSYRLKFDKINDDETTLSLLGPQKTFLRYFYYLPIGFFAYFLINYLLYLSTNTTLLFFEVTDLLPFYLLLLICFVLVVPVSVFIVYRYNFIKRLIYEINYTKNDIVPNIDGPNLSLNLNALQKQFSYIRVVWNQAKKAFNEQNYSLFIIKADTAVKKLVETRYVQFAGSVRSMDFNTIIKELRLRGLDIPSNKKIEYFHQIRNKVVHTSHLLLDEKTAIETFNYYSKFLNRLGMRT